MTVHLPDPRVDAMRASASAMRVRLLAVCSVVALLGALAACGGDDGGVRPPIENPAVVFTPAAGSIVLAADQSLRFSVADDQGREVAALFTLDGDSVAVGSFFDFVPSQLGALQIVATVQTEGETFTAVWVVQVDDSQTPATPEVFELFGEPGPQPGSISLLWERPPPSLIAVPIVAYEVATHVEPFGDDVFETHRVLTQNDVASAVRQRATLFGLAERDSHMVRVRALDAVGRVSVSRAIECEATGQYALSGSVFAFPRIPGPSQPSSGVVIEVGTLRGFSGLDGNFQITGIPDLTRQALRLSEQTGATYYEIDTGLLSMQNRAFRMLLVPRGLVQLVGVSESTYPGGVIERLDFLRLMRETHLLGTGFGFPTWTQYPVRIFVHPVVQDARGQVFGGREGELVDYAAAFRIAVDLWNEASGVELLELVEVDAPFDPSEYASVSGAIYDTSLGDGASSILGRLEYIRPAGGRLYFDVPQLQVIKLRSNFNFQDVAQWVITHEVGHVLGLGHSPSRGHIMLASVSSGDNQAREPDAEEALLARLLRDFSLHGQDMQVDWLEIPE